jgi:hypothetical protein
LNVDTSIALGVVSVVLTVVFFIIGYRQTIGARKERARATNKDMVATLLRRFTLDSSFVINREGVGKLLTGAAIESRVKLGDLFNIDQLEAVLYTKIIEHDFLDESGRDQALGRLENSFKAVESTRLPLLEAPADESDSGFKIDGIIALSFLAAALGIVASLIVLPVVAPQLAPRGLEIRSYFGEIVTSLALAVATATALSVFVKFRDANRTPGTAQNLESSAQLAERAFSRIARRTNKSFEESPDTWVDYKAEKNGEKWGIEFKYDINRYGLSRARQLVQQISDHAKGDGFARAFLVSGRAPLPKYTALSTDFLSVVSMQEMLSKLRQTD